MPRGRPKKQKKELTLDANLVDEFLGLYTSMEKSARACREDISDLKVEFVDKGLNVKAVMAVLRAERSLAKTGTPDDDLDNLAIRVRNKLDITELIE